MDIRSSIEAKLREALTPEFIDVVDQSAGHAGHAGASGGGHYHAILVSRAFEGLNQLQRQRRVYQILAEEMRGAIHALAMTCLTPAEYEAEE
jgi:BolA protein